MKTTVGVFQFSKKTKVNTTTLNNLINSYGLPYFIKIDVEGHEEQVIKGLTHPIPIISFEANLPQFLEHSISIVKYLLNLDASSKFRDVELLMKDVKVFKKE